MNLQRVQSTPTPQRRAGDRIPATPPPAGSPLGSGSHEQPILRLNLLRALQLHRRLALGIALAGLVLAAAYIVKAWPAYTAQSQIYIQPVQSKVMSGADQSLTTNSAAYDSFVQQQVQSASNPEVLLSALHKLKKDSWQRNGESEQAAATRLGGAIEVARAGTSYEVTIDAKAKDPQLVAQIANAVAASIVERASGEGNAGNAERISVLSEERDRIQAELNSDYAEQSDLNKQLGMAAVGAEAPDLIDADIGRTREELIKARTDHDQAQARFAAMGAGNGDSSTAIDAEADDLVAADAGLTSMKTSLNARRATLITQMSNLTPSNPEYKQDAAELAKINGNLDTMMKDLRAKAAARIQEKLKMDLERTAGVETRLNGQLRQLAGTAASATPKLQRASDLATDIARLRNRYTTVDMQLHNLMLESSAPGAVHLSVAAVAPLHPSVAGILKKVLPLALGGVLLGLLAAVLANYLDPRVYIGADVEQVLGFAPMAVLPDFDEVSNEVSAEHLLRLSSAIEHARKQGDLNNCIFTGTAAGTGVTTLATRVREILEAMGRPAVLLNSSGTSASAPRASSLAGASDEPAAQRGSRSTALLKQVTAESETRQESLVLTDTAPLLISAETEYLARFVDCAIVVAESGVTTRAQLLAAVKNLQRLEVAAMGFVLNRVKLAKADPEFRHSVYAIEQHHRAQSRSASWRTEGTSQVKEERLPEARELPNKASVSADRVPEANEPALKSNSRRSSAADSQWQVAAPVKQWLPQPPQPAPQGDGDTPWWLLDAPSGPPVAPPQPEPAKAEAPLETPASNPEPRPEPRTPVLPVQPWETSSFPPSDFKIERAEKPILAIPPVAATQASPTIPPAPVPASVSQESAPLAAWNAAPAPAVVAVVEAKPIPAPIPAPEAAREKAPVLDTEEERQEKPLASASRLSGLRGLFFSLELKNLNKTAVAASPEEETPAPKAREPERPVSTLTPAPFNEPVPVAAPSAETRPADLPQRPVAVVTAQPEFLPPKEFIPVKDGGRAAETASPSRNDRRETYDELRVLPSRRGQYRSR